MLKKNYWLVILATIWSGTAAATSLPSDLTIDPCGRFTWNGLGVGLIHFNPQWQLLSQVSYSVKPVAGFPVRQADSFELRGTWQNGFTISEKITAPETDVISCDYRLATTGTGVSCADLALCLTLPSTYAGMPIQIDGKAVMLPEKFEEKTGTISIFSAPARQVIIPTRQGNMVISGNFTLLVQDDRKFNLEEFSLRFRFSPCAGNSIKDAALKLNVALKKFPGYQFNLAPAMNMDFADETAGDGKGGWTDQGKDNDLRMFKPGKYNFFGLNFQVINPTDNNRHGCIVLNGPTNPAFPKTAEIAVNATPGKYLYLLHATGWTPLGQKPVGTIEINYADGQTGKVNVTTGTDVGNWWSPLPLANGLPVWTAENQSARVGLYLSRFTIADKPVKSIKFTSAEQCLWLVVAASGTNSEITLPKRITLPITVRANAEWQPFIYHKDIEPGSIMDFSSLLDAPAGKYGNIIRKGNHFAFRDMPDKPVRFYGANLCFGVNFMSREQCEQLADRLARMGYNSVRFHHFDGSLVKKENSTELDPTKLDRFDYLFAALKKRGIYLTIDLYTLRSTRKGEIPEYPDHELSGDQFKGLSMINCNVRHNWEMFSRNLLTHINPYTGMAWKDDPALICISLINENTVFASACRDPLVVSAFEQKFVPWLKARGLNNTPENKARYYNLFLTETYNNYYREAAAFVRGLGVRCPLTDQNYLEDADLCQMRKQYDYVDVHIYADHPSFPVNQWRIPIGFSNRSSLGNGAGVPLNIGLSRIFSLPMMCTEFDFVNPNQYRAEGGLLMGAYSALQDWDGIYRFAYSHGVSGIFQDGFSGLFDVATNPVSAINEKMGVMLYLRGDVKKSDLCFPILVPADCFDRPLRMLERPAALLRLGLIGQIGVIPLDKTNTAPVLPDGTAAILTQYPKLAEEQWTKPCFNANDRDLLAQLQQHKLLPPQTAELEKQIYRSSTGELELNQKTGTFKVLTPRSEGAVLPAGQTMQGKMLTITANTCYGSFMATATDGKALAESTRILLLHQTNIMNSNAKFNGAMTLWEEYGTLPYLIQKGKAEIFLRGQFKDSKLYAVDMAGKRRAEVPLQPAENGVRFIVDTHLLPGGVVAYELVRPTF